MAINKKLIHFKTFATFNSKKLSADETNKTYTVGVNGSVQTGNPDILYQSICYIKDTKQQWTHGQLYDCSHDSDQIADLNNKLSTKVDESYVSKALQSYLPISKTPDTSITFNDDEFTVNILNGSLSLYTDNDEETPNSCLSVGDRDVLTADSNGVVNKTALSIGGFQVRDVEYQYHIKMYPYMNYDDVAVKGFMGDLVGTTTISGTSYYKFDCIITNTSEVDLDRYEDDTYPQDFHRGYVYIPTSYDIYDIDTIEALQSPTIIIDEETVRLSSECNDIHITRNLPYSLRPTGTRCYINNERVATVNDIPEGIVTAYNNRLNQDSLYISGDNDDGYDCNTWWDVSIAEPGISLSHRYYSGEASITLNEGQVHISSGYPGMNSKSLKVTPDGIYESDEYEVYEGEEPYMEINTSRLVNETMLNQTLSTFMDVEEITHTQLRYKAERGKLIPGKFYKITDYTAVTSSKKLQVVNHDFDIIVQAIDSHTLSHDARACAKSGDMYFSSNDLSAWKLKYDTVADESKYPWVPNDVFQEWFCDYGILHKTIVGVYPTYFTKTINGELRYLYHLNCGNKRPSLGAATLPDGLDNINDVILVTESPSYSEDDYLTLFAINKNTGDIYNSWEQTYRWTEDNIGFGGDSENEDIEWDVYSAGSCKINGRTYYRWESYEENVDSRLISSIGGTLSFYGGSYTDLYCVTSKPLSHELESYACWSYYDVDEGEREDCSIDVVDYMEGIWSATTDVLYTLTQRAVDDEGWELDIINTQIGVTSGIKINSKGVIYHMSDDKGNSAPFDFKNIQILIGSGFTFLFGTNKEDNSLSLSCDNVINGDGIPSICLQGVCTNNKITCVNYTDEWISTHTLTHNNIYLENKSQLTDCPYTNCTVTLVDGCLQYSSTSFISKRDYGFSNSTINIYNGVLQYTAPRYTINMLSIALTGNVTNYLSLNKYPSNNKDPYTTVVTNKLIGYKREDSDLVCHQFSTSVLTLNTGWYHQQTSPTTLLILKLVESSNIGNTYQCEFTTHKSGTSLSVPSWLRWENGDIPELENNTTYLLTIIGDKARCKPFYADNNHFKITYTTSNSQTSTLLNNVTPGSMVTNTYNGIGTITYNKPITYIGSISSNSTLKSLVLPDSVTTIHYRAFSSCTSLTDLTIGSNIQSGDFTSSYLRNIYVPSITSWVSMDKTYACPSTLAITCGDEPLQGSAVIPEGVSYIGKYALRGADFYSITIPSTVTSIGSDPFPGFSGDLYINSQDVLSNTYFTTSSSYGWGNPSQIWLGGNITTIPSNFHTLSYSNNLSKIYLPNSLMELQSKCLYYTHSLYIPALKADTVNVAGDFMGYSNPSSVWTFEEPSDVFKFKLNINSQTPISSRSTLYYDVRLYDSNEKTLTQFTSNKNVIFDYALASYQFLRNLTLTPTSIGAYAFYNCKNLGSENEVTLGNKLQFIGDYAFCYTALKTITLPKSVSYIGNNAFASNSNLKTVYCKATVPPEMPSWAFYPSSIVYVPRQSLDLYKQAPGWSTYASKIQAYDFPDTFTFTIGGMEYEAEQGMTWREWVNSGYNTNLDWVMWHNDGYTVIGRENISVVMKEYCSKDDEYDCWYDWINVDDYISPNDVYYEETY